MKRIIATLLFATVTATLLVGCSTSSGSNDLEPVNLSDNANISALCGDEAQSVADFVASAAKANPNSGKRNALKEWGVDPKDDKALATIQSALNKRAQVKCDAKSSTSGDFSDELKALLDASRAPSNQCLGVIERQGGAIVNGTYALRVEPAMGTTVKEGDPNALQWSDSLDLILKGSTPGEMKSNLEAAICNRPLIGVSLAHLFAHLEINGTKVLDLQSTNWLDAYNVSDKEINNLVGDFVPLLFVSGNPTDKQYEESATASRDYQKMASKLIFLLSRYELGKVMAINSTHHYHLVAGGLTADGVPEVEVSSALDNRPALVFYLTEKTECKPISVLAFNVGDKRPELGDIPRNCTTLTPPPPVTTTPGCTGPCLEGKNGHIPRHGSDNTTDSGVGTKPPASTPTTPAQPTPDPVDTGGNGPVDTGTNLGNESGNGSTGGGDTSDGVVTD